MTSYKVLDALEVADLARLCEYYGYGQTLLAAAAAEDDDQPRLRAIVASEIGVPQSPYPPAPASFVDMGFVKAAREIAEAAEKVTGKKRARRG